MSEDARFAPSCPLPESTKDTIELAHGGGGLLTQRLIEGIFRPAFAESARDLSHDGAILDIGGARLAFTTDSYVVRPLFFPGGDIGSLAVNGTVNDLAMCGAEPRYLSVGLVLEEGFAIEELRRIVESMRVAARAAGVKLVTGDTKVVERGRGDGLYINTSGVGLVATSRPISPFEIAPGDVIVASGDIARHGIAVMAAREALDFETRIESDSAPLAAPVRALIETGVEVHCLRDLTRGGLATALIEIAETRGAALEIDESAIAVSAPVRGACEILGLDPLYVANEGRFVAFVPAAAAQDCLAVLRRFHADAAVIGRVGDAGIAGAVSVRTLGGSRALDLPLGEQLPRIC